VASISKSFAYNGGDERSWPILYLEHTPSPLLAPYIRVLWYACDPQASGHQQQRVLPSGSAQIVLSLARDFLTDANHPTNPIAPSSAAVVLGVYTRYQQIDAFDFAGLMGVSFHPGGTLPFFRECAHHLANCETPLEDLWPEAASLRCALRDAATVGQKFNLLESVLLTRLGRSQRHDLHPAVRLSLAGICSHASAATVSGLTRQTGFSTRRLAQLFHEQVGVSPKLYCRIRRFQQAIALLHAGGELPWADLALACGYYDQSHFSNDFRAFSGISPSTYSASARPWANHVELQ
jgi:AraC-like DNA-binding protein